MMLSEKEEVKNESQKDTELFARNEISFSSLLQQIIKFKISVFFILFVIVSVSVYISYSLPNVYKSEALLAPVEEQGGMNGLASQFGGLASFAGLNIDGGSIDKTSLALEIMNSRAFIFKFIKKYDILIPLMGTKGWDQDNDAFVYDLNKYDPISKTWVRDVNPPLAAKPSLQEAYIAFKKHLGTSQNKTSSMITISMKSYSPHIAKEWVELLIKDINEEMKLRDLKEAQDSLHFLDEQLEQVTISEYKDVIYQLVEEQTKKMMFANIRKQYILQTIDPPLIPLMPDGPPRILIILASLLIGIVFAVLYVLIKIQLTARRF
ncbi:MAG: Wzz/FepE/Etk N-terminal domain-containing protein [Psychrobium sp.]